uniref:RanBP2-type domain-containing protein n=1 Tax=Lotharella globosa TaxID=91324 RepID=A0A7S4DNV2_9EUKA
MMMVTNTSKQHLSDANRTDIIDLTDEVASNRNNVDLTHDSKKGKSSSTNGEGAKSRSHRAHRAAPDLNATDNVADWAQTMKATLSAMGEGSRRHWRCNACNSKNRTLHRVCGSCGQRRNSHVRGSSGMTTMRIMDLNKASSPMSSSSMLPQSSSSPTLPPPSSSSMPPPPSLSRSNGKAEVKMPQNGFPPVSSIAVDEDNENNEDEDEDEVFEAEMWDGLV